MSLLQEATRGNKIYQITFPKGEKVAFRLLSWQHFKAYNAALLKGTIPSDVVEDTVFRQCILDKTLLDLVPDKPAGFVSTVVGVIMALSGPADPESFNNVLDVARHFVDEIDSQVVMTICRAFPAYKPTDLEVLPWHKIAILLAQAERLLINAGVLKEPLHAMTEAEMQKAQKTKSLVGKIDATELVKDAQKLKRSDHGAGLADEHGNTAPPTKEEMEARRIALAAEVTKAHREKQKDASQQREAFIRKRGR